MPQIIKVPLPEDTYKRAKQWAKHRQREIGEALASQKQLPMLSIQAVHIHFEHFQQAADRDRVYLEVGHNPLEIGLASLVDGYKREKNIPAS